LLIDGLLIISQVFVAALVYFTTSCVLRDRFEETFLEYIRDYGKVKKNQEFYDVSILVDGVQEAVSETHTLYSVIIPTIFQMI